MERNDEAKLAHSADDDALFAELFASLDDVKAPDALKQATLASIFGTEDAAGEMEGADCDKTRDGDADESSETGAVENAESAAAEDQAEPELPQESSAESTRIVSFDEVSQGAESRQLRKRPRFRVMRLVAAAACVAALGVGGVAYATPTATVSVSDEDAAVELNVNMFGIVVGSDSADEEGKRILAAEHVDHKPYEESLDMLLDAFDRSHGVQPVDIEVKTGDERQHDDLQARGRHLADEKGFGPRPDEGSADEGQMPEMSGAPDASAAPTEPPAQGGDQPPAAPAAQGGGQQPSAAPVAQDGSQQPPAAPVSDAPATPTGQANAVPGASHDAQSPRADRVQEQGGADAGVADESGPRSPEAPGAQPGAPTSLQPQAETRSANDPEQSAPPEQDSAQCFQPDDAQATQSEPPAAQLPDASQPARPENIERTESPRLG